MPRPNAENCYDCTFCVHESVGVAVMYFCQFHIEWNDVSWDAYCSHYVTKKKGKRTLPQALEDLESQMVGRTLMETQGNKAQAAKLLGINRTTLVEMIKRKKSRRARGMSRSGRTEYESKTRHGTPQELTPSDKIS